MVSNIDDFLLVAVCKAVILFQLQHKDSSLSV